MSNEAPGVTVGGLITTSGAAVNSTLPVVMAANREYKTLPRSFQEVRKPPDKKKASYSQASPHPRGNNTDANKSEAIHQTSQTHMEGDHSAMFNINTGLSNLISGGMHFLGQLGRRKNSGASRPSSPPPRSSSALGQLSSSSESSCLTSSTSEAFHSAFSSIGNVKKKEVKLLKEQEFIEMTQIMNHSHLPHAEGGDWEESCSGRYLEEQVGKGHDFAPLGTFNPTWCDLCRELVWGLYDTGATRCIRCHLTCHVKCQFKIKLNCVAIDTREAHHEVARDTGSESDSSTISSSSSTSSADEIDHDESTLANISTLREEYHDCADVDTSTIIPPPDEFSDKECDDLEDEEDYNRTLKDVSLMEDFTLDDDTPTTLPKDPFPPISSTLPKATVSDTMKDPFVNTANSECLISIDTISSVFSTDEQLAKALAEYNKNTPSGQKTVVIPTEDDIDVKEALPVKLTENCFDSNQEHSTTNPLVINNTLDYKRECRGYIRVVMNLRRPINVAPGTRPPSTYTIPSTRDISGTLTLTAENAHQKKEGLTSFYLPVDTVKALHVTTITSVHDVIRTLLAKFRVVDNPHKFALYEKISTMRGIMSRRQSRKNSVSSQGDGSRSIQRRSSRNTLVRHNLRKMSNEERPLVLALARCLNEQHDEISCENMEDTLDKTRCYYVLQENDPGEMISWESFSQPELKNFLRMLDREEAWYKKRIHEKYELVLQIMQKLIEEKRPKGLPLNDNMHDSSSQSKL